MESPHVDWGASADSLVRRKAPLDLRLSANPGFGDILVCVTYLLFYLSSQVSIIIIYYSIKAALEGHDFSCGRSL